MTQTLSEAPLARKPRRTKRAIIAAAVLCLAVGGVLSYHWLTDDRLLATSSWNEGMSLSLGHTYYSGLGSGYAGRPPDYARRLNVTDVHAVTSVNTAAATVTVLRCVEGAGGVGLTAGGNAVDNIDRYCVTNT